MARRRRPVKGSDVYVGAERNPEVVTREHTRADGPSTVGHTVVYLDCPFCGEESLAYMWSLSGGGKRCSNGDCRALFNAYGGTHQWAALAAEQDARRAS